MKPCNVPGCDTDIPWRFMFCRAHLMRLPGKMRAEIKRACQLFDRTGDSGPYETVKAAALKFLQRRAKVRAAA